MKPRPYLVFEILLWLTVFAALGFLFAAFSDDSLQEDKGCFTNGGPICHEVCQDRRIWFWFVHEDCAWQPINEQPTPGKH